MSPFWSGFFNQFRDSGRDATWFLVTLGGGFVLVVLGAWAMQSDHANEVFAVAAVGGVLMICQLVAAIRRAVQWQRHRLKFQQLSSDELDKARSKLTKRSRPAGPRGCDALVAAGGRDALVARAFSFSGSGDGASPALSATRASQLRRK